MGPKKRRRPRWRVTIVAPGEQGFVSGDASRWTPWGGYLTAEESWAAGSTKGRLFEVTNPITAGPNGGDFVWRRILPRVSHEGLAFDTHRALYFIDELNGGSIYKFVSANPDATDLAIDAEGNVYIVEDRGGGSDDDIWFAADWNMDGDLLDPGEGLARWASNGTAGSEFTGLYFDVRNRTGRSSTFSIPPAGSIG